VRLVLDTSVIVSSVRSETGASRFVVEAALAGRFEFLLSVPLVLEYEAVLHRDEHLLEAGLSHHVMDDYLNLLSLAGREIPLGRFIRPNLPDAGDEHVLNLALRGHADGIVTQNLRHFPRLMERFGVELYSPQDVARLLRN
jgi:predicted nucleic acid-binding protein